MWGGGDGQCLNQHRHKVRSVLMDSTDVSVCKSLPQSSKQVENLLFENQIHRNFAVTDDEEKVLFSTEVAKIKQKNLLYIISDMTTYTIPFNLRQFKFTLNNNNKCMYS